MGQLDQYAKEVFAEETESVTRGGASFQPGPEIGLSEVRLDGLLVLRDASKLEDLAAPWPAMRGHAEVALEVKMPGDHLDIMALQRVLLRRQVRQVQRVEASDPRWEGEVPLWVVAPHVPEVLRPTRELSAAGPGCYRVEPGAFPFLWIAANELPLREELLPFLVARSGKALEELGWWAATCREPTWVAHMPEFVPMSDPVREEMLRYFKPTDDPERLRRRRQMARVLLEGDEEAVAEILEEKRAAILVEGRLIEARAALRGVLAGRKLAIGPAEEATIATCKDLATLERWHAQALTASTAVEALR